MRGVAIVAIPPQDDYVWKISSETVPHLTLCFLGNLPNDFPIARVTDYVEHVAKTSMHRFGLAVDERGTLGDNNADVLFFKDGRTTDWLEDIRAYLLQSRDIRIAYDTADQYEEWTPHLTLGYPQSPAHPDPREYPGTSWVSFDRIALWTADFEGPEFRLEDDSWGEMSMGATHNRGAQFLSHFGVKGMQWGVRKSAKKTTGSTEHKATKIIRDKARKQGVKSLTNKQLKTASDRLSAEQRFSEINTKSSKFTKGHNAVKGVLAVAGTATTIFALATSPAAKAGTKVLQDMLKK